MSCLRIWNIEKEKGRGKEKVEDRSAQRNENKSDREPEGEKIAKETCFCWKNDMKIL